MIAAEPDIFDTAAQWLARLGDAPLAAADEAALLAWLRADPRHAEALDAARAGWALAGELAAAPAMVAERRRARTFRQAGDEPAAAPRPRWAALVTAAAVAGLLVTTQPPPAQAFETVRGQSLRAVLADGSVITLNTDSRVVIYYGWLTNTVTIERGEAAVAPAGSWHRALRVLVNATELRPQGSVAVRDLGDSAPVLAVGAAVELRQAGNAPVLIAPAQRGVLAPGQPLRVTRADPVQALAWQRGLLVFDHTSLATAVAEFERYGTARLTVAPRVRDLEVSGAYRTSNVRAFLDALPTIHPVRWRQVSPGEIRIEGA